MVNVDQITFSSIGKLIEGGEVGEGKTEVHHWLLQEESITDTMAEKWSNELEKNISEKYIVVRDDILSTEVLAEMNNEKYWRLDKWECNGYLKWTVLILINKMLVELT